MPLSLLLRSANSVLSCAMKSPGSHTLQICTMTLLVKNQAYINGKWTSAASGATFDGKFTNNIIIPDNKDRDNDACVAAITYTQYV